MKRFIFSLLMLILLAGTANALTKYGKNALNSDEAMEVLRNYLVKAGKLKTGHILMIEDYETRILDNEDKSEVWSFRHAEDGGELMFTIRLYYVSVNDGAIYALDILEDEIVPVDELDKRDRERYGK